MRPVLRQIGDQNAQQQLRQERDVLHILLKGVVEQFAEQMMQQEVHGQQSQADNEMIDREVLHVGLPFLAENGLPFVQREQFFDHHENQCRAEQIQNEPVQPNVRRVI